LTLITTGAIKPKGSKMREIIDKIIRLEPPLVVSVNTGMRNIQSVGSKTGSAL